jgi:hypothetical protein
MFDLPELRRPGRFPGVVGNVLFFFFPFSPFDILPSSLSFYLLP